MKKTPLRVGIVGCGRVFWSHLDGILSNPKSIQLVAVCDQNKILLNQAGLPPKIAKFNNFEEMLTKMKGKQDLVTIATPNSLHFSQALASLNQGYDILVEKPVALKSQEVNLLSQKAKQVKRKAFSVLQVRYNQAVLFLKKAVDQNLLGRIYSVSLVQRWQRPADFFTSWRGNKEMVGGVIYEVGIHYLDILRWILGTPQILATYKFNLKHKQLSFEDTIYSFFKFRNDSAGNLEITLAAEPSNLECSLTVLGEKGAFKLGGKSLNKIEYAEFLAENEITANFKKQIARGSQATIVPGRGKNTSAPNYPSLYQDIVRGKGISVEEAGKTIKLIENIYEAA